jgi:hypothetical protein
MRAPLPVAFALLAAACGREGEVPAEPAGSTPPPAAGRAPAVSVRTPASRPALALDGEGLRLVDPGSGRTRLLPFGLPEPQVLAILEPLRGAPEERSRNDECGAGPLAFASWPDGLQLVMSDGRFVGWSLDEPGLETMSGLGLGSTRAELLGAYDAQIEQSTLGPEFSVGGLSGLLSSAGERPRVTTLWAGTICAFR